MLLGCVGVHVFFVMFMVVCGLLYVFVSLFCYVCWVFGFFMCFVRVYLYAFIIMFARRLGCYVCMCMLCCYVGMVLRVYVVVLCC